MTVNFVFGNPKIQNPVANIYLLTNEKLVDFSWLIQYHCVHKYWISDVLKKTKAWLKNLFIDLRILLGERKGKTANRCIVRMG